MHYTYIHLRASDNTPFYVGKGQGNRAHVLTQRNNRWHRTANKHGLKVEVAALWTTEREAFEHEKFLIWCFRDMGLDLCNMTDGGEGASGAKHPPRSAETRRLMSQVRMGHAVTQAQREKLRLAGLNRKASEQTRKKISESAKRHSQQESVRHGRSVTQIGALNHAARGVLCITTGQVFGSVREAARHFGETPAKVASLRVSIAACCAGHLKTSLKMKWRFVEKEGSMPDVPS